MVSRIETPQIATEVDLGDHDYAALSYTAPPPHQRYAAPTLPTGQQDRVSACPCQA